MSRTLDEIVREAFADPMLDFLAISRTPRGDFCASVKRAFRGYGVHYDRDLAGALEKAVAAPASLAHGAFKAAEAEAVSAGRIAAAPVQAPVASDAGLFD